MAWLSSAGSGMLSNLERGQMGNLDLRALFALDETLLLRSEWTERLGKSCDENICSELEQKMKHLTAIYCVAYSRSRLNGWAIVFNFSDAAKLCHAIDGNFLLHCRMKKFLFEGTDQAKKWIQDEIQASNDRLARTIGNDSTHKKRKFTDVDNQIV